MGSYLRPHGDIAAKSISTLSAFFDNHRFLEQCEHVTGDAEKSQNYQFSLKKQLLIPTSQDEIVKGVNGWTLRRFSIVCNTHLRRTHNCREGGREKSRRPALKAGRRAIYLVA